MLDKHGREVREVIEGGCFTLTIFHPDEDGVCHIEAVGPNYVQYHGVRYDQARQWAHQELDCLNEYERKGVPL